MKVKETCIIACFVIALLGMRQTLEAKWGLEDVIEKGQILYELGGGSNSILNPESVTEDELPILLKNPKREGYLFGGWYLDENWEERIYRIEDTGGKRLYAKWNLCIEPNRNVQEYPYKAKDGDLLLKDLTYSFLYELETPGNPGTRIQDLLQQKYASEYQCPQGLCITPDYIIVSSYALEEDKLGALTLYDRTSHTYIMSFGMEADSHLGGIAYDGKALWICHSNSKEVERISYAFIKKLAGVSRQNFIDITSCFERYPVDNTPSAIACMDGQIYVATHHVYTPGILCAYTYDGKSLTAEKKCLLPPKVQGICRDETGRIFLSLSYGRNQSSYLNIYSDMDHLQKNFWTPSARVEMPPGSEAIAVENGICYVLFETASYKYFEGSDGKGTCKYPLDKILLLSEESIFYD